jgi:hypothetical protein
MRGNKAITPEICEANFMEHSEMYATAKCLADNTVMPNDRYAEKAAQAWGETHRWLDLYIDLYPERIKKLGELGVDNAP